MYQEVRGAGYEGPGVRCEGRGAKCKERKKGAGWGMARSMQISRTKGMLEDRV